MLQLPSPLVDVNWLHDNLHAIELIILDASVPPVVPGYESLNSEECFLAISGARRFDYDYEDMQTGFFPAAYDAGSRFVYRRGA